MIIKPTVAAVSLALAALTTQAADFTITNPTNNSGYFAGVFNPTEAFTDNVVITTGQEPANMARAYGFWSTGTGQNSVVNGNLDITLKTQKNAYAWGLYAQSGAHITVNGNTTINQETDYEQSIGIASRQEGAHIDLSRGTTTLTLTSSAPNFIRAIDLVDKADLILGKSTININVAGTNGASPRYVQGIYAEKSTLKAKENVAININGKNADGQLSDLGSVAKHGTRIRAINIQGSGYNSDMHFDKDLSISVIAKTEEMLGIFTSTDNQGTAELHSRLDIGGNMTVHLEGEALYFYGAQSQGEASIKAGGANITILSKATGATAYGLAAQSVAPDFEGVSGITVSGNTTIEMSGKGNLHGAFATGIQDTRKTALDLKGNTDITVRSDDADAIGLLIQRNSMANIGNLTVVSATHSDNMVAKAVQVKAATLNLQGSTALTAEGNGIGLDLTNGIVNVSSGVTVHAKTALQADADTTINIGSEATAGSLVLKGDVANKGTINLTNSSLEVSGLSRAAQLGTVNTRGTNESTLQLAGGEYDIDSLTGDKKAVVVNDLAHTKAVRIGKNTGNLMLRATGQSNDQHAGVQETADALMKVVTIAEGEKADSITVLEGKVNNGLTATIGTDGKLENIRQTKNSTLDAYGSIATLAAFQWRHEMDSVNKRMGDLRSSPNGVGTWARIYGSEQEYGAQNLTAKNHSIQVGADTDLHNHWKVGAAFTYTDGKSTYNNGRGDNKAYGITAYGTWLDEKGQFLDLAAKYSRLDNDFNLNGMKGNYDNNAFSVSAEYGWHLNMTESAFVEPQVEVMYGRIAGTDFTAENGVKIEQDNVESLIARAGLRSGVRLPNTKGLIYARASVLHDFKGELDVTARYNKALNTIHEDIGGTWFEMGLGANVTMTPTSYLYMDMERTSGGEVTENWRYNIGLRKVF